MTYQDRSSGLPGPAPFNWNTGNGTAMPAPGISGVGIPNTNGGFGLTGRTPPTGISGGGSAPNTPGSSVTPTASAGGGTTPSASDNPGFGGLQFSSPPGGVSSTPPAAPSSSAAGGGLQTSPVSGSAGLGPGGAGLGGVMTLADGGSVPDDPITAAVNQAMDTVSSLFDFGRQKHGLNQGGGDQAPMGPTWGQMPNTSGVPNVTPDTTAGGKPIGGSTRPGEIQPTPLHDDASDKGYSNPTETGLPPPQVQGAARGGSITGSTSHLASFADGGSVDDDAGGPDVDAAAQGGQQDQPQDQGGGGIASPPQGSPGKAQGLPAPGGGAGGSPQRAIGYLTGEGAMPSKNIMALEQQVDPHGKMSPEIRKLLAVHAAAQQGPEAGWAAMQHYRQRFLMLNGVAAAQMKGNPQKPPNPALAARTATDAYSNSLDGNKIAFQSNPQGMTVHVQPYKRPTQPSMSAGGAIPSYADGGSVGFSDSDTPDAPFLGQEVTIGQPDTTGSVQSQGGIPGQSAEMDRSAQTRDNVPITRAGASAGLGAALKQGIYNISHPYFMKLATNAAGHDELQEKGPSQYFDEQGGVNMAGQVPPAAPSEPGGVNMAGSQPAPGAAPVQVPKAPSATEGAPAPTTGKQEATDQAIKGGEAAQPEAGAKETDIGKLITLSDGTKVYENLWNLARQKFPWASEQKQMWDLYNQLRAGHVGGEEKIAAAELKGTQQAGLVDRRNAGALERNQNTNAVRQETNEIRKNASDVRHADRVMADQTALKRIAVQSANGDKALEGRIIAAGTGNFQTLPPAMQQAIEKESNRILGVSDEGGTAAPAARIAPNKAATAAQGNMQELGKVGKFAIVNGQRVRVAD